MTITQFRVEDPNDSRIREFLSLTDMDLRRGMEESEGVFIAEGFLVLERVMAAGLTLRMVLTDDKRLPRVVALIESLPSDQQPVIAIATGDVLRQITGFNVHRGLLVSVNRPSPTSIEQLLHAGGSLVVLEGLVDPTNVGLAFRSAAAMGFNAVVVSGDCADPLYRRAVRTSMGAVIDLPWARDDAWPTSLDQMRAHGVTPIALTPDPRCPEIGEVVKDLPGPIAAVFGSEGPGLRSSTRRIIDRCARIPMDAGIDSLNIAASVAVVGYAVRAANKA